MRDEYALEMVDKLFSRDQLSRNKMPGLKETVKERREIREHRFVNILRNRAKINHDKIIRMGFLGSFIFVSYFRFGSFLAKKCCK